MMDSEFIKLDLLAADLQQEINNLYRRVTEIERLNKMLEDECAALRDQNRILESQVYSGKTF
jgi:cell division protein FtsB